MRHYRRTCLSTKQGRGNRCRPNLSRRTAAGETRRVVAFQRADATMTKDKNAPAVVELAGLPGSGKTTICSKTAKPWQGKGSVGFFIPLFWIAALPAGVQALGLCLSARPFTWARMVRGINLIAFFRHYSRHNRTPMLLDQGIVQNSGRSCTTQGIFRNRA